MTAATLYLPRPSQSCSDSFCQTWDVRGYLGCPPVVTPQFMGPPYYSRCKCQPCAGIL